MLLNLKEKIEEVEKKCRFIADNLIEAVFVIDANTFQFIYVSPSIEKVSGYPSQVYQNFNFQDRLSPASFLSFKNKVIDARERFSEGIKEANTIDLEFFHKDLSTYWAEIRFKFYMKAKSPLMIIGVIKEITERKNAEERQQELIEQLREALAEKERLLKENKVLKGLLPICSGCKRIRDDYGRWWPLDAYIKKHTEADITHTICPDCTDVFNEL